MNALRPGLSFLSARKEVLTMELKLKALYEPLDVEIGSETVHTAIDVTADNLVRISEVCTNAQKEMKGVSAMLDKARRTQDHKLLQKMNKKAAEVMKPAIVAAIGQEGYDDIVKACGAGRKVSEAACNVVMTRILTAIMDAVVGQQANTIDEKAAHYLAEVEDAQPEPYQAE